MLIRGGFFIHLVLFGILVGAVLFPAHSRAEGGDPWAIRTASLEPSRPGSDGQAALPGVLISQDADTYRQIFDYQEDGEWNKADALIARLNDRLLMGHVLAQRYLHPTKYRSKYKELKAWMDKYADHPDARRIYKLALRRQPKNWRSPKRPIVASRPGLSEAAGRPDGNRVKSKKLPRPQRQRVRQLKRTIRGYLRKGYTLAVKKLLRTKEVQRLFSVGEFDEAKARLGAGYFAAGRDEWALHWAGEAAKRSGKTVTRADWTAGLAAWRLGRFVLAAKHFEAVAANDTSPWMVSAAAFWAARSHLVDRRPEKVNPLLAVAAAHPRTFYGLLARRMLGLANDFNWRLPRFDEAAGQALMSDPLGRRAIALIEAGERRRAERELKSLAATAEYDLALGVLALASRAAMPSLAMRLDEMLFPGGGGYDGAAYPLPDWQPKGGFRVDRALIYALIRQESRFNTKAKSRAGARGLMQLMPRTAGFVARDRGYRWGDKRRTLHQPEVNLTLGQKYIEILLSDSKINGDLFLLAAAWNGGPGNLNKWRRTTDYMNDPLFFIESIPSRETRIFIERVFTNLWIYRHRLDQPAPSLDTLAAGEWPVYTAIDGKTMQVAESVEDRRRKRISPR